MKNEVQIGRNIDYLASQIVTANSIANAGLVLSGEPCVIGDLTGIVANSSAAGTDLVDVQHHGVFNISVTGATTLGASLYIAPASGIVSTTNTGKLFGYALAAQAATGTIPVKLKG